MKLVMVCQSGLRSRSFASWNVDNPQGPPFILPPSLFAAQDAEFLE